uniref:Uncharacterized protein n=1 Tax=Nelumbo nucifera TaxID=4432 RepID=A0A822YEB8_NELNU|nr:TPA_asm: hypothetical protein HUJ06_030854 [Nelumbo nucifera]
MYMKYTEIRKRNICHTKPGNYVVEDPLNSGIFKYNFLPF